MIKTQIDINFHGDAYVIDLGGSDADQIVSDLVGKALDGKRREWQLTLNAGKPEPPKATIDQRSVARAFELLGLIHECYRLRWSADPSRIDIDVVMQETRALLDDVNL